MNRVFLAVDTGYSFVKYAYETVEDTTGEVITPLKKGKFITAIATVDSSDDLGIGERLAVKYKGDSYLVGEIALNRQNLIPTRDDTFLIRYSPLLIHEILRRENLSPDFLVVSLSITEFAKKRNVLREVCSSFTVDDKTFTFPEVKVMPQGIGIWEYVDRPENAMILDIGFNTIDIITILNGKPMPEFCLGYKNIGVSEIANAISNYLNAKFDGIYIPELALVNVLDSGVFQINGEIYNVEDIIEKKKRSYTERILTTIRNSVKIGNIFNTIDKVVVAGGGAYFIDDSIRDKSRFLVLDEPEFANVLGFLKKLEDGYVRK